MYSSGGEEEEEALGSQHVVSTSLITQTNTSHKSGAFGVALSLLGMRMMPCLPVDRLQQPPTVLMVFTNAAVCLIH